MLTRDTLGSLALRSRGPGPRDHARWRKAFVSRRAVLILPNASLAGAGESPSPKSVRFGPEGMTLTDPVSRIRWLVSATEKWNINTISHPSAARKLFLKNFSTLWMGKCGRLIAQVQIH